MRIILIRSIQLTIVFYQCNTIALILIKIKDKGDKNEDYKLYFIIVYNCNI